MLDFNKKLYARNDEEAKSARAGGQDVHGFYAPLNGGFKLFDADKQLQAYVSRRPHARMVVSAYTFEGDGRDRYMQALSTSDTKWLGFPANASLAQEQEAIDALREFDLETEQGARWVIYNADKYIDSDEGSGFWSDEYGWTTLAKATRYGDCVEHWPPPTDRSQLLEIGTMQDFRLMIVENPNDDDLDQTPILFPCFAEDMGHAIEQAASAYPGCRVMGRESGDSPVTFSVSWADQSCVPAKRTIHDVAWWRDEASEHDDHTLRVMYASDGRMMGSATVGENGEVEGWSLSIDDHTESEVEESFFAPC